MDGKGMQETGGKDGRRWMKEIVLRWILTGIFH